MTEHVLAALAGMGVDNCRIELNGPELPGLDGSALPYVEAIEDCGFETQWASRSPLVVQELCIVRQGDASVEATFSDAGRYELSYELDYSDNPGIGIQSLSYLHSPESFAREIHGSDVHPRIRDRMAPKPGSGTHRPQRPARLPARRVDPRQRTAILGRVRAAQDPRLDRRSRARRAADRRPHCRRAFGTWDERRAGSRVGGNRKK